MNDDIFTLELEESPGGSASESDKTINKNISGIISMLATPSPDRGKQTDTGTPVGQPLDILQNVVAFVDVRSNFENRSKAITHQLVQLGATVVPKFTNEITHVIFKDGKKVTKDRAKKKGLHLVSVLWIEACKRNREHMPEKNYPANVKDESGLPLAVTRLKKNKSMQPKDFEEELANSAEKVERKRKRLEKKEKWKVLETPVTPQQYNRGQFYVAETQTMSPVHLFHSNISIPETPPSMRRKLEALRRKKQQGDDISSVEGMSVLESPTTPPVTALQKRLFRSNTTTPSGSPQSSTCATPLSVPLTAENIPGVSFCLSQGESNQDSPLTYPVKRNKRKSSSPKCISKLPVDKSAFGSKGKSSESSPNRAESSALGKSPQKSINISTSITTADVEHPVVSSGLNLTKGKTGKKKLLRLDETLPEKLLSPVMCLAPPSKSTLPEFPKPKKSKSVSAIVLPASSKVKSKGRKRKTDELNSSDSDGSKPDKQKKAKHNVNESVTPNEALFVDKIGNKEDSKTRNNTDNKSSRGRRKSVATSNTPISVRTSRRRSCMPAFTPDSKLSSVHEQKSSNKTSTLASSPTVPAAFELSSQSVPTAINIDTPDQSTTNDPPTRVGRRKSVQPKRSPIKSTTTTIVQRRSRRSSVFSLANRSESTSKLDDIVDAEEPSTHNQGGNDTNCPLEESNLSEISSNSITSTLQSMSSTYNNSTLLNLTKSRRSVEEFSIPKRLRKKGISMSSAIDSSDDETNNPNSQGETRTVKKKKVGKISKRHNSDSSSDGSCCALLNHQGVSKKRKDGFTKSIVMTSLHSDEQDSVRAVTKSLGEYFIEESVSSRTTHVVCGNNRRTLNILLAISKGCWLVSLEWVFKSLEAGHWLEEEPYEQCDFFPAAQMSRLAKTRRGDEGYSTDFFSDDGLIYVAENTAPSHQDLVHLLQLCGAQVTHCVRKAQICVGAAKADAVNVSEKWILDSITSHKRLSYDNYRL